jgi:hypothetical protein
MTAPTFPRRELAIGWHALADVTKKKALVIGEVKVPGSFVVSGLDIITKPTEAELNAALEGYEKNIPRKRDIPKK